VHDRTNAAASTPARVLTRTSQGYPRATPPWPHPAPHRHRHRHRHRHSCRHPAAGLGPDTGNPRTQRRQRTCSPISNTTTTN